jgi:hypothetical protein
MWKGMKSAVVLLVTAGTVAALGASAASAALPEIGRCLKVEATREGSRKVYHGKYTNRKCTTESRKSNGKFEWTPGPGTEKGFESPGASEPVNLETAGGTVIACTNSKMFGEITGEKTETDEISLYGCQDVATKEPCQSLRPKEVPPTPEEGTILSQEVEAELGFISKSGKKPKVGWDYKAKSGSDIFIFECGKTGSVPTAVTIEGSFIGQVKPVNRMREEFQLTYSAPGGKQQPEMFEGGAKDTLTATLLKLPETLTEQIGYSGLEEQSVVEDYELRASA